MAVYNNRYYPDSRTVTWANIASYTWEQADYNWLSVNTTAAVSSTSWSYTTAAEDLGYIRSFYPVTLVVWDDQQPVTIEYEYSNDDATYTTTSAAPITARYLKTKITTTGSYLTSINTIPNFDPIVETYYNINTASLSGNVTHRILNTNNFSQIQSVSITSAVSETRPIGGQIVSNNTGTVTIRAVDLDTWDKVAVDANVNIVVVGFPILTANTALGTVGPGTL